MSDFYDKNVYEKMDKALQATCRLLVEKQLKEKELIKYRISKKITLEERGYGIDQTLTPEYHRYIFKYGDDINILKELDELANARLNSKFLKRPVLSRDDGSPIVEEDYLQSFKFDFMQFLHKYVMENEGLSYNKSLFKNMYVEYEYYKVTEKVTYDVYCPLLNFSLKDIEEFIIEEEYKIRKIEIPEIEKIVFDEFTHTLKVPTIGIYDTYVIHTIYESEKGHDHFRKIHDKMIGIITALRLFKEGNLHYELVRQIPITWVSSYSPYVSRHIPSITIFKKYELKKEEITPFINFYNRYIESMNVEQLTMAISRLSYAYERTRNEDKLIDYAIALDSIFTEEVRPRGKYVGSSCGMLIGNSFKERKNIKEKIIKGYEIRNDIVHGKKYSKNGLDKITPIMESYLKASIKKLL